MLTDIYKIFDQLRLNPSSIGIAVVFMTVLWIFALREIFSWLMKTNQIAKQFKLLHQRLDQIERKLAPSSSSSSSSPPPPPEEKPSEEAPTPPSTKNLFEIHR